MAKQKSKRIVLSRHEVVAQNYHLECGIRGLKEHQEIIAEAFPQLNLQSQDARQVEIVYFGKQSYVGIWHFHGQWTFFGLDHRVLDLIEQRNWQGLVEFRGDVCCEDTEQQTSYILSDGVIRIEPRDFFGENS